MLRFFIKICLIIVSIYIDYFSIFHVLNLYANLDVAELKIIRGFLFSITVLMLIIFFVLIKKSDIIFLKKLLVVLNKVTLIIVLMCALCAYLKADVLLGLEHGSILYRRMTDPAFAPVISGLLLAICEAF